MYAVASPGVVSVSEAVDQLTATSKELRALETLLDYPTKTKKNKGVASALGMPPTSDTMPFYASRSGSVTPALLSPSNVRSLDSVVAQLSAWSDKQRKVNQINTEIQHTQYKDHSDLGTSLESPFHQGRVTASYGEKPHSGSSHSFTFNQPTANNPLTTQEIKIPSPVASTPLQRGYFHSSSFEHTHSAEAHNSALPMPAAVAAAAPSVHSSPAWAYSPIQQQLNNHHAQPSHSHQAHNDSFVSVASAPVLSQPSQPASSSIPSMTYYAHPPVYSITPGSLFPPNHQLSKSVVSATNPTTSIETSYATNVATPTYHYNAWNRNSEVEASPAVEAKVKHALQQQNELALKDQFDQMASTGTSFASTVVAGNSAAIPQSSGFSATKPNAHGLNSILSLNSDLPVTVSSRLVKRDGPHYIVEALLSLDGVCMGAAQSSGPNYEDAESAALLSVMDRCTLPVEQFQHTRISGPYFSSHDFDDSNFPLSPTRPPRVVDPHKSNETFAPDDSEQHDMFGFIPPPVASTQPKQCDVSSLATNALYASLHKTQPVPLLSYYRNRSLQQNHNLSSHLNAAFRNGFGYGPSKPDPRLRLQEYLFSKSMGIFAEADRAALQEASGQSRPHSSAAVIQTEEEHVKSHLHDLKHPSPHARPRLHRREYYDPSIPISPKRQLMHHFLQIRSRSYSNIQEEVAMLRQYARSQNVEYEQMSSAEKERLFMKSRPWANVADAKEWLSRLAKWEATEEPANMRQSDRIIQHNLALHASPTRRNIPLEKLSRSVGARVPAPTTPVTIDPRTKATSNGFTEDGELNWRNYTWHWGFMKTMVADADRKLKLLQLQSKPHGGAAPIPGSTIIIPPSPAHLPNSPLPYSPHASGSPYAGIASVAPYVRMNPTPAIPSITTKDPLVSRADLPLDEWNRDNILSTLPSPSTLVTAREVQAAQYEAERPFDSAWAKSTLNKIDQRILSATRVANHNPITQHADLNTTSNSNFDRTFKVPSSLLRASLSS